MLAQIEIETAGGCASTLIAALESGSRERIGSALDRIAALPSHHTADSMELEFRDLLVGLVEQLGDGESSRRAIAMRMLAHVATASRNRN